MVGRIIKEIDLVSTSKRQAVYQIRLVELPDGAGFVVAKWSGPTGGELIGEAWYREDLRKAEEKYAGIVKHKTTRTAGRIYHETPKNSKFQMSLF